MDHFPSKLLYDTILEMDSKFKAWEMNLPIILSTTTPDTSLDCVYPVLNRQRCALHLFYHQTRMILFRPLMSMSIPRATGLGIDSKRCRDECVTSALAALRSQEAVRRSTPPQPAYLPDFTSTFFLFDAAATLCVAVLEDPHHAEAKQSLKCLEKAVELLQTDKETDTGGMIQRTLLVLRDLWAICQKRRHTGDNNITSSHSLLSARHTSDGPDGVQQMSLTIHPANDIQNDVQPPQPTVNSPPLPYMTSFESVVGGMGVGFNSLDLLQSLDEINMNDVEEINWQALFEGVPLSPKQHQVFPNHFSL